MQTPTHQQHASDDADRQNRFLSSHGSETPNSLSLRERAASQPPHSQSFVPPPPQPVRINSGGAGTGAWGRFSSGLNPLAQSVPTRSASFSSSPLSTHSPFSSAMRDSRFASTFEDDESEALSDIQDPYDPYDERFQRNMSLRGRTYTGDLTRSRSQSLATSRPGAIGSGFPGQGFGQWDGSTPQSIPTRYDFKTPTSGSRYGSLGALGRSPSNGYSQGSITDPSNMSPFVRDVGQILLDDGSAFRELWAGMNPPRDENGGGGSGTTSRRHSVSVVQPRRPIVGFNAPNADVTDDSNNVGSFASASFGGGGGLLLTDDDLASDLGLMSINDHRTVTSVQPPSQPSSLPIYAPLSRSPPSADRVSPYQALHLNIPGGAGSSYSRQSIVGSPSDSGLSGGSPSRGHIDQFVQEGNLGREPSRPLMARYVPGHGIQQIPEGGVMPSPLSPATLRSPSHYGQQQMQRRSSDASKPLNELGKGVPLHAVPTSWPLYIVEFKAGRTDLFYCTDLTQDIRVGDLVIVEADRGKDLGKVVNDTITLAEVEAFQKQQKLMSMGHADVHGVPTSPTGAAGGGVKDINPKMIYGKAQHRDTQGLAAKAQDEAKALELCRNKVRQRKLPMEVVDAEYQWDRRKLTFYFVAEKRIDFRELVRELFRLYKTRIWMASLGGTGNYEQ
ncbi:PSP1-domain-containing protein [Lentinus tigrinus ALCF2SS1-7]|uniref:PSP1-domain-containing protein n=1 Tax=Lentinus tigrinus ALCF2SS1-6 TaxID=1328759 RepID=A0A5C2S4G1_9APHY|nr:PSP1-domain-containing protein [Lentinus tigrinus ALCF2SS1-6]RPD81554.1 PSP1-domain-containing protein [Lentinus tigrinus ALCF2SS1-7]